MINLLIFASFLGHLRCIKDETFVRSGRKKILTTYYIIYK